MSPLEALRHALARADALLPLSLLGVVSGLLTGAVIVAFRLLTESTLPLLGLTDGPENFETLDPGLRLLLPLAGGLAVGLMFQSAALGSRQVGVVHVMERLAFHSGRLPWRNAVLQFFGGALALISGHSVGREGPVIHVGAASSSLMGQWLGLPHNSLRTLVGCGTAASIAASFNTPLAGVVFAMEVVMMEYTLVGFTPVILAAISATSLSRLMYGPAPAFQVPAVEMLTLWELPYICALGVLMGTLAALFIRGVRWLDERLRHVPLWLRMTVAGGLTGLCGLVVPQVMGIGYDTVNEALLGGMGLGLLLAVASLKLLATTCCVGLGVPGGLIGPTLVVGAAAGGAMGVLGHAVAPDMSAEPALYAVLGMGAMMAATLQAPLAALTAVLELTANPAVMLPGMLAVVTGSLTCRLVFGQRSVFVTMLRTRGLEYLNDPVAVSLARTGVGAVMSRRFVIRPRRMERPALRLLGELQARWLLVTESAAPGGTAAATDIVIAVLPAATVVPAAQPAVAQDAEPAVTPDASEGADRATARRPEEALAGTVDVLEGHAPAPFACVRLQATLAEALAACERQHCELVLVTRNNVARGGSIYGVLTRDEIQSSVRYGS